MEPDDHSSSEGASEGADLGLRGPARVGARVSSGQPIPVAGTWEVVVRSGLTGGFSEVIAGAGPAGTTAVIDLDATIVRTRSDKQDAAATYKATTGTTPC